MPQPRQRIVFCDCLDCVQQPATTDLPSTTSPANEAAARQEPPPKCLAFVLSGALVPRPGEGGQQAGPSSNMETVLDACNVPHLHRAAAQGSLCLLTLRDASPADGCSELAQLLNAYEEYQQQTTPTSLAERFKGMVSSFASNCAGAARLAASVGMGSSGVLSPDAPCDEPGLGRKAAAAAAGSGGNGAGGDQNAEAAAAAAADTTGAAAQGAQAGGLAGLISGGRAARANRGRGHAGAGGAPDAAQQLPDPAEAARRILQELGLQQADAGLDLLMVHIDIDTLQQQQQQQHQDLGSGQQGAATAVAAAAAVLSWLDRVLRYLNNAAAFKEAVLLTVLATPGSSSLPAVPPLLAAGGGARLSPRVDAPAPAGAPPQQQEQQQRCVLRPLQSWEQLGGQPLAVSRTRPLLCLRRLPGVIRRDGCARFSLAECCAASGTLGLAADRLLPEVAYKLGRAPKYGA